MKLVFIARRFFPQIILAVLVAIFFIANPKAEKSFDTALVNPKYEIDRISLRCEKEGSATLSKCGAFWICEYASPERRIVFPCENSTVEKFIENSRNVIKVYEISDSLKNKNSFSLSDDDAFSVEFSHSGETVSKILFGSEDSRLRVAFCVEGRKKIFCTDSAVLSYLTLSPDFWCDPNIFPESVCGNLDGGTLAISPLGSGVEKDLPRIASLRHGKIFFDEIPGFSCDDLRYLQNGFSDDFPCVKIDDGKGNVYQAFFMPTGGAEGDYFCRFVAFPSSARNEREALAIKSLDYVSTVSAWTFSRIFGD